MFDPDDDGRPNPIVIGCVEAAYASLGLDVKVYLDGLVLHRNGNINEKAGVLDSYPIAHRLYIALAGEPSPVFRSALESGAKHAGIDDPELIDGMLDDSPHDDLDLLIDARSRAIQRALRDRSPLPVFATGIEERLIEHRDRRGG